MKSYGLLGETLGHSLSPQIHRHILEALGVQGQYALFEAKRIHIPYVLPALYALGFDGVNVTIPYKTVIMPYLDEVSPQAKAIGAVNVIDLSSGQSTGYNTDCYGFGAMLETAGIETKGKRALILGAGGAAKAAIVYLHSNDCTVRVAARDSSKLALLVKDFPYIEVCMIDDTEQICGDVLINSTPVGMHPHTDASPLSKELVARFGGGVVDMIYNPAMTKLLSYAANLGLPHSNGLNMLIFQAIKAQEIWQNAKIDHALAKPISDMLLAEMK